MHSLISLLFIHFIALSTPGPDTLVVIRESSIHKKNGILCIVGICIGVLFYSLSIMLGLSVVLERYPIISYVIAGLGILYLSWVGINLLKSKGTKYKSEQVAVHNKLESLKKGLLTNLSNPKAIIYFTSVFSQFKIQGFLKMIIVALSINVVTFIWFALLALFISAPKIREKFFKHSKIFDKISGVIFLIFSIILFIKHVFIAF